MLITKNGTLVAQGTKIHNHLYHMKMVVKPPTQSSKFQSHQTFVANNKLPTWETWHWHFGHVGYTGLQKLLDSKMVDKFIVDEDSPKPDCIAVRATPKSNSVDNMQTLQGNARSFKDVIKVWWEWDNNRMSVDEGFSTHNRWWES